MTTKAPGVLTQRFDEHRNRQRIEVVGRLVENQKIGRMKQRARQRNTALFPAGQHADALEHIVAGKKEGAQHGAEFPIGFIARGMAQGFEHRVRWLQHIGLMLREKGGLHTVPRSTLALERLGPVEDAGQSGLARPVLPDQRDLVSAFDRERPGVARKHECRRRRYGRFWKTYPVRGRTRPDLGGSGKRMRTAASSDGAGGMRSRRSSIFTRLCTCFALDALYRNRSMNRSVAAISRCWFS